MYGVVILRFDFLSIPWFDFHNCTHLLLILFSRLGGHPSWQINGIPWCMRLFRWPFGKCCRARCRGHEVKLLPQQKAVHKTSSLQILVFELWSMFNCIYVHLVLQEVVVYLVEIKTASFKTSWLPCWLWIYIQIYTHTQSLFQIIYFYYWFKWKSIFD